MARPASVIEDVEVTREEGGRLRVTWKVAGECDQVDLSWGRSADGLDHVHALRVPAAAVEVVLDPERAEEGAERAEPAWPGGRGGADRRRVYVSVAPAGSRPGPGATVAAERRIAMLGPVNFRDLGGYKGDGGRTVRWGQVFRSDALLLDDDDLVGFAGLGIRTVYDLRSESERNTTPNRLPEGVAPEVVVRSLVSEDPDANPLQGMDSADGEDFLEQLYMHILERSATNFGSVLTGLSREEHLPAVFHCAAGKDRTGMVAAVLLSILGVALEDILDDYELTSRFRTTEHVQASMARLSERQSLAPELIAGMLRAPRWAMESALTKVAGRYGDFDGYLTGPAAAAADVPDRLRALLLSP
jgi:protein-tyrosine phosphatase